MKSASASQESQPAIYICGSLFEQNGLRIHGQSTPAISRRQRGDIPLTVIMLDWCTTRASPRQINATSRHTYLQRMYMNVNVCIYIYIYILIFVYSLKHSRKNIRKKRIPQHKNRKKNGRKFIFLIHIYFIVLLLETGQ